MSDDDCRRVCMGYRTWAGMDWHAVRPCRPNRQQESTSHFSPNGLNFYGPSPSLSHSLVLLGRNQLAIQGSQVMAVGPHKCCTGEIGTGRSEQRDSTWDQDRGCGCSGCVEANSAEHLAHREVRRGILAGPGDFAIAVVYQTGSRRCCNIQFMRMCVSSFQAPRCITSTRTRLRRDKAHQAQGPRQI